MKNYYEILQVDKNASSEVINRIYKYHIKKNHPDLFEGDEKEQAKQIVQEFNEAYEVLSNEEKRKEYDESLNTMQEENYETENGLENLKRLEEENEILKQQLLHKDRLLKEILNELNIPYADEIEEIFHDTENEEAVRNVDKNKVKNNVSNRYVEYIKISFFKIVLFVILFLTLMILLSDVTGKNYIEFLKSLF